MNVAARSRGSSALRYRTGSMSARSTPVSCERRMPVSRAARAAWARTMPLPVATSRMRLPSGTRRTSALPGRGDLLRWLRSFSGMQDAGRSAFQYSRQPEFCVVRIQDVGPREPRGILALARSSCAARPTMTLRSRQSRASSDSSPVSTSSPPAGERHQLGCGGDDDQVLRADSVDHARAQLLVAAPEQKALTADDAHDDARRTGRRGARGSRVSLSVRIEACACAEQGDSEQAPGCAQLGLDSPHRRARPDQRESVIAQAACHLAYCSCNVRVSIGSGRCFRLRHQTRQSRRAQKAVQRRREGGVSPGPCSSRSITSTSCSRSSDRSLAR